MSTKILHGQMSVVDKDGNVQKLHQETSSSDVLINRTTNKQGTNGTSVVPSDVNNVQQLSDKLGGLAFKTSVTMDDLPNGNYVVMDETTEEGAPPESEINDDVTSDSLTWSSNKINSQFTEIAGRIEEVNDAANSIFYIHLVEDSNGKYTAQETVAEIEAAYRENKAIWIVASTIFLPLRKRQDANTWIFSGYTETQAYDITLTPTAVTFTYTDLVTSKDTLPNPNVLELTGAVSATYDGSTKVTVEIPSPVEVSEGVTLGETETTAFRGDYGKTAYDHSKITTGNPHKVTKTDIGLGNVENKSASTILSELTKDQVTNALGYTPPETDTKYTHPISGVTAGTYNSVTVDTNGHVTAGSNVDVLTKAGGTMTGDIKGASNNSGTNAVLRNIVFGSESNLASFASTTNNGTILIYTS